MTRVRRRDRRELRAARVTATVGRGTAEAACDAGADVREAAVERVLRAE
jgi:hypothetical protein